MTANRRARCPNGLIEEAQNLWGEIVTKYELGEHELSLLRSVVKALTALRKVQAELERDGVTIRDRFDQVREHPNVRTLQVLDQQFRNNLSDLGLGDADAEVEKSQEKPATFNKNGGFLRKVH
jgi:phage terminase small subunit